MTSTTNKFDIQHPIETVKGTSDWISPVVSPSSVSFPLPTPLCLPLSFGGIDTLRGRRGEHPSTPLLQTKKLSRILPGPFEEGILEQRQMSRAREGKVLICLPNLHYPPSLSNDHFLCESNTLMLKIVAQKLAKMYMDLVESESPGSSKNRNFQ